MTIRSFSFGGGRQSTAALVLAAQGAPELAGRVFLFANVGEDSERAETLRYVEEYAKPFAADRGIEFHELRRVPKKGKYKDQIETVYGRCVGNNRSIVIPVRMSNGAPGNRSCTNDFKIRVIVRWLKEHGANKSDPASTGIGFTWDELHRIGRIKEDPCQKIEYPLIDLRMTVHDCIKAIENVGLPVPPKSACWFCPYQSRKDWLRMRSDDPALFDKAVALEHRINEKRGAIGRNVVYLHPALVPLEQAVGEQYSLFDDTADSCETGYCFM